MDGQSEFIKLQAATNEWVSSLVPAKYEDKLRKPKRDDVKVIRDALHGYQILSPHEYLVLDHPLLQRLRYIHQTGLAYLVYPTAHHTRFDHSLGCAKIAEDIGKRLIEKDKTPIEELRLAALLHDVGHTFFSHLSECIMQSHFKDTYEALKKAPVFQGLDLQLSEMMSYFIIKSEPFDNFLRSVVHSYSGTLDLDNVANMIIHNTRNEIAFMGDIISGSFDVDKLDYLVRDCFFTGIRVDVDIERVVISTQRLDPIRFPETDPRWRQRILVIQSGGVSILEQIVFNKMLLFPAIYHHHKVRAIECMVKSLFEVIWTPGKINDQSFMFNNIIDFYKFTEPEFMVAARNQNALEPIVMRLLNRDLIERCLVLSPRYVNDPSGWKHLSKRHYEDAPIEMQRLREYILQELPPAISKNMNPYDLWVDIPKPPKMGDPDRAFVDIGTTELLPLSAFFPYSHWVSGYEANKLKGHVFCPCDSTIRKATNMATKEAFKKHFGLEFGPRATNECKLD